MRIAGQPAGWAELAGLIADELTSATGVANDEFGAQVRSSHAAMTAIGTARAAAGAAGAVTADLGRRCPVAPLRGAVLSRYLASEQALVAGHRFHPAPKARGGDPREWLPFAPEAGARFPLRFLAVRGDALDDDGDTTGLDRLGSPAGPAGYHLLPAHPWQLGLLSGQPWLRRALRDRLLIDLGAGPRDVVPTSSVRTVYDPAADLFCKFSLNVRITNCVRKNSWYELAGAVALTGLLGLVFADVAVRFPGAAVLGEPGYRTVALAAGEAAEGLSVIVREGLSGCLASGATPLLAAALTEPPPAGAADRARRPAHCWTGAIRSGWSPGGRRTCAWSRRRCCTRCSGTGWCSSRTCRTSWWAWTATGCRSRPSSATWRAPSCSPRNTTRCSPR